MNGMENFGNGVLVETLTGTRTLLVSEPIVCKLDPGGAGRTVKLPGAASSTGPGFSGGLRYIVNAADAAEDLSVTDMAGNAIATINQSEAGLFMGDSVTGAWTLVHVATIALS